MIGFADSYDKHGFTFRMLNGHEYLVNPNENSLKEVQRLNVKNVELSFNTLRNVRRDITFLKSQYDFIEGISVYGDINVSALNKFKNLRRLSLQNPPDAIVDFDNLPLLED